MTELTVNVSKDIRAPIEKVFDAWLDPAMLAKFMLPAPGMDNPDTSNDPREGGEFEIVMKVGEQAIPHTGRYLEISRPNKLAFTWASPFSPDDSVVTLNFSKIDEQQTHVELHHVKFIGEEERSSHEGGWTQILVTLNEVLTA